MTLGISLVDQWLRGSQTNNCHISISNDCQTDIKQGLVNILHDGEVVGEAFVGQVASRSIAQFPIGIKFNDCRLYELQRKDLFAHLLMEMADGEKLDFPATLGAPLVLPAYPPYLPGGAPVNRSFQGREELIEEICDFMFDSSDAVFVLEGPYLFGKTSLVKNLRYQPRFVDGASVIVIDAGSRQPDLSGSSGLTTDTEQRIARAIFPSIGAGGFKEDIASLLAHINDKLKSQGKYLLVVVDTLEEWFDRATVDQDSLEGLHRLRNQIFNRVVGSEDTQDRVKWLFSGSWALDPVRSGLYSKVLVPGRPVRTRRIRVLTQETGSRVVTAPSEDLFEFDDQALVRIGELTGWHPMLIQIVCFHLYRNQLSELKSVPRSVSADDISNAADMTEARDAVSQVVEHTLDSFQKAPVILDVLGAVKSGRDGFASNDSIVNRVQMHSHSTADELRFVSQLVGYGSAHATLYELMPGILRYLLVLGLLDEEVIDDGTPRYRMTSKLIAERIAGGG